MSQDSETDEDSPKAVLNQLAAEFDQLCQERHFTGAREYGPTGFIKNNMFRMIAEEMADIANYCRYEYIKLRLMEGSFDSESSSDFASSGVPGTQHPVPSPAPAFISGADLQDVLQGQGWFQDPGQRGSGGPEDRPEGSDRDGPGDEGR